MPSIPNNSFGRVARAVALISLVLVLVVLAFGAGVVASPALMSQGAPQQPTADLTKEFAPFWQVWSLVEDRYVFRQEIDHQKMTYGAIEGMLAMLNDEGHTRFLSPSDLKAEQSSLEGQFDGIGAEVTVRNGRVTIVAPIDGSPAEKAGLKPGDIIAKVDGVDVTDLSLSEVVAKIRGPRGTTVNIDVVHVGQSVVSSVAVVRQQIKTQMVTWAMVPGTTVAHLRITQFGQSTDNDLRLALKEARAAGATSLIADVRNNPGGLLEQAVDVTSEFVDKGAVLLQEDRTGKRKSYDVLPGGQALDLPTVVLINEGSASASEIFAGALQDDKRAQLVGRKTFGTGTVLTPFPLADGSELLLGTGQWLTPNGRAIRKQGIVPDVDIALLASAEIMTPREERTITAEALAKSTDAQLLRAIELAKAAVPAAAAR